MRTVQITRELDEVDVSRAFGCPAWINGEVTFEVECSYEKSDRDFGTPAGWQHCGLTVTSLRIDSVEYDPCHGRFGWATHRTLTPEQIEKVLAAPMVPDLYEMATAFHGHSLTMRHRLHTELELNFSESAGEEACQECADACEAAYESHCDARMRERRMERANA